MKSLKTALLTLLLVLAGIQSALAGHVSIGIGIGVPVYGPRYYYPPPYYYAPPYYYPPVVVAQPVVVQPPQYIEQTQPAHAPTNNYWYYCAATNTYYPYVKECAAGWQQVVPQQTPPPR